MPLAAALFRHAAASAPLCRRLYDDAAMPLLLLRAATRYGAMPLPRSFAAR